MQQSCDPVPTCDVVLSYFHFRPMLQHIPGHISYLSNGFRPHAVVPRVPGHGSLDLDEVFSSPFSNLLRLTFPHTRPCRNLATPCPPATWYWGISIFAPRSSTFRVIPGARPKPRLLPPRSGTSLGFTSLWFTESHHLPSPRVRSRTAHRKSSIAPPRCGAQALSTISNRQLCS